MSLVKSCVKPQSKKPSTRFEVEFELIRWDVVQMRGSKHVDPKTRCPVSTIAATQNLVTELKKMGMLKLSDLHASDSETHRDSVEKWTTLTFEGYRNVVSQLDAYQNSTDAPDPETKKGDRPKFCVYPLPKWLVDLRDCSHQPRIRSSVTSETIRQRFPDLYSYQVQGVLDFFAKGQNMYLADTMGLGKTAQSCACILLSHAKNVLIVCPASVRKNWENELSFWEKKFAETGPAVQSAVSGESTSPNQQPFQASEVKAEGHGVERGGEGDRGGDKEKGGEAGEPVHVPVPQLIQEAGSKKRKRKSVNSKPKPVPLSSFSILKTGKSELTGRDIVSYPVLTQLLEKLQNRLDRGGQGKGISSTKKKGTSKKCKKMKTADTEEGVSSKGVSSQETFRLEPYDFVVFDESHFLKNGSSLRTKAALKILKLCRPGSVLMLSGTPMDRPCEMYVPLRILLPRILQSFKLRDGSSTGNGTADEGGSNLTKSFQQLIPFMCKFSASRPGCGVHESFGARYCRPKAVFTGRNQFQISLNGSDRMAELKLVTGIAVVRREKDAVLDLPPKVRSTVVLEGATASELRHFQKTLDSLTSLAETKGKLAADVKLNEMVTLTSDIKIRLLPMWLKDNLFPLLKASATDEGSIESQEETKNETPGSNGKREDYLFFARHHSVLDFLARVLTEHQIGFVAIDGRTNAKDRQTLVQKFRDDETVRVAVLGIQSAGTGLNFQTATQVIFFELTWSQKDILQAEDRAHRIGVKSTVFIMYLCLQGSTDDFMLQSIRGKTRTAKKILHRSMADDSTSSI